MESKETLTISKEELHVGKVLGRGTYAECRQVRLRGDAGSVLCLKELLKSRSSAVEAEAFKREIEILQNIQHPFIVKFVGGSNTPTASFMLLECLSGGSLRKLILQQMAARSNLYSDADALRWCTQLASAIVCLHTRTDPILHRDLHPDNILLTNSRPQLADIRLIDFGLHRILFRGSEGRLEAESADVKDTQSCGHPRQDLDLDAQLNHRPSHVPHSASRPLTGQTGAYMYMSPEMVLFKKYDTATDIFSFGCVMYELYSRTLRSVLLSALHVDPNAVIDYANKVAEGFRPEIQSQVPAGVAEVIRQCWQENPATRPTASQLLASLQGLGGSTVPAGVASPSFSKSNSGSFGLPSSSPPGLSQRMWSAFMRRVSIV
eukprot:jgi/Botrbrau1/9452/Bobra.0252s0073.1